ncbi:alpha-tocopherol transfer protein-like [Haemaphysalis longicornis]
MCLKCFYSFCSHHSSLRLRRTRDTRGGVPVSLPNEKGGGKVRSHRRFGYTPAKEIGFHGKASGELTTQGNTGQAEIAAVRRNLKLARRDCALPKTWQSGRPHVGSELPDLQLVARTHLGETPEVRERSLYLLRQLIAGEEQLHCPADDSFLVKFLRARKYRVMETFKMIRSYFLSRQRLQDYFSDLSPHTVLYRKIFVENRLILVSKLRDPKGRAVVVLKFGAWNSGICSLTDLVRAVFVTVEWVLLDEETQIRGVVGVVDLSGLHVSHLMHFSPIFIMKMAHVLQDCYPARVKAIYLINGPPLCELLYGMVKPFLKAKLTQRCHFIGRDLSKLHGIVPPDCIPAEFGGTHEDFDYHSQERDVKSTGDYFQRVSRWGYRNN